MFMALAFLPKMAALVAVMPKPVMGATLIVVICFVLINRFPDHPVADAGRQEDIYHRAGADFRTEREHGPRAVRGCAAGGCSRCSPRPFRWQR